MRKGIAFMLILMLIASVALSGCGNTGATNEVTTTTAKTEQETTIAEKEVSYDPLGKYETPITLTYARAGANEPKFHEGEDYENNVWIRDYESELGIIAKEAWIAQGEEDYQTKLTMRIASNDLPDLFQVIGAGQREQVVRAGYAEELTEVFNLYASDMIKEVFSRDNGRALGQATYDGKLMALPQTPIEENQEEYIYIRDDWREKLGIEKPENLNDLIDLARAFTKNDPDQNGSNDTYGFVFSNAPYENYMEMKGFFNCVGAFPDQWIKKDGKLVYGSIQPAMKDALALLKEIYEEELFDPEFIVKDSGTIMEQAVNGTAGINFGESWVISWPLPDSVKLNPECNWVPYPLLYSDDAEVKGVTAQASNKIFHMIKKGYKHPEAIVKMQNYFAEKIYGETADPETYHHKGEVSTHMMALVLGYAGTSNPEVSKIVTKAIDENDTSAINTEDLKGYYNDIKAYLDGDTASGNLVRTKYFYGEDSIYGVKNKYIENNMFVVNEFYGEETNTMTKRMANLKDNETMMILKIITGEMPLDYFDTFVEEWNSLGGEAITQEVNEWYQSMK